MALQTFDQSYYLTQNPDVLNAVLSGTFSSAEEHYVMFGEKEGRMPNANFDALGYLTLNPDVFAAVQAGVFSTGLEHYEQYGAAEDRSPGNLPFSETFYLAQNEDVAAAVADGTFTSGWQHFVLFGYAEGRVPDEGGQPGTSFELTTGVDTLVGTANNDTFEGLMTTLGGTTTRTFSPGDSIDAAGGIDTFNLLLEHDLPGNTFVAPVGASVSNVEIVNLISNGNVGFSTGGGVLDASFFDGATQIWQVGDTLGGFIENVGDGVTIGFRDTAVADVDPIVVADDVTSANVALDDVTSGAVVRFADTTAGDLETITVSGSVAGAGAVTMGGLAVNGIETINLGLTTDSTVTFNGAASVTTVDASASSGDLTFDTTPTAADTILGGSGDDTITVGAPAEAVTGGAGADTIDIAAAAATTTTLFFAAGDTGLTAASSDDITGFTATVDEFSFGEAAGDSDNFLAGGASSGYVDALTNANTAFDGVVQYFYTFDAGQGYLFVDRDLDGTADEGIELVGLGTGDVVAADIIA